MPQDLFYLILNPLLIKIKPPSILTQLYIFVVALTYIYTYIWGAFNKFPDVFRQAFKIVVDSWKFTMLLLYILWDDRPIFMILGSSQQLQ